MRTPGVTLFAVLLLAAPAAASPSFRLDSRAGGRDPDLSVDDVGTARVAWRDTQPFPSTDAVRYCVVPRGSTTCSGGIKTIPTTGLPASTTFFDLAVKKTPGVPGSTSIIAQSASKSFV